jgi:hypothetical protein
MGLNGMQRLSMTPGAVSFAKNRCKSTMWNIKGTTLMYTNALCGEKAAEPLAKCYQSRLTTGFFAKHGLPNCACNLANPPILLK